MKKFLALLLLVPKLALADGFFGGGGGSSSTPLPTSTPASTPTPRATDTPAPTATPANTPVSTATAVSTPTPRATDTPIPTPTPELPPVNFTYSGKLTASDFHSNTTSTTVAHRIEACGSGASGNVTMTMPSTDAVGDVFTLVQRNTSHSCIFSANSGATLNGASTLTIAAGVATSGNHEDCLCVAISAGACTDWECGGPGT